ncbi:MAG: hypothetical protein U0807_16225 [Candidatus Binatia bacterium]
MRPIVPALLMLAIFVGCTARVPPPATPPPADSPLTQIRVGMRPKEVTAILGEPAAQHVYETLNALNPFYFENDAVEYFFHYPHLGRVVFGAGRFDRGSVIRVEADPSETGVYQKP